jgi:hypothetical protein
MPASPAWAELQQFKIEKGAASTQDSGSRKVITRGVNIELADFSGACLGLNVCIQVRTYVRTYVRMYVCMVCMYVCMCVCLEPTPWNDARARTSGTTPSLLGIYIYVYICTCACMYVCESARKCIVCVVGAHIRW